MRILEKEFIYGIGVVYESCEGGMGDFMLRTAFWASTLGIERAFGLHWEPEI